MSTKEIITEKKQFRELSDEELEKVTGGAPPPLATVDCPNINPFCKNRTMDEYGCEFCIS